MTPARKAELEARAAKLYRMICTNDLILGDLTEALEHVEREVWAGLKVTNEQLQWALKEVGPSGTRAEAYVLAVVEYVIAKRTQAKEMT